MKNTASILVIDDEEAICFAFQRHFEPLGFRVRVAPTGATGLAAYTSEPADVVFLDVRLPDADGLDILARLRERDPTSRVVIITAHGSLETVTRALRGQAFEYLVKPIDLDRAAELAAMALASDRAAAADAGSPPAAGSAADRRGGQPRTGRRHHPQLPNRGSRTGREPCPAGAGDRGGRSGCAVAAGRPAP